MAWILEDNPALQGHLREIVGQNRDVLTQLITGKQAVVSTKQTKEVIQFLEEVKAMGSLKLQHDIDSVIKGIEYGYLLKGLGIHVE